MRKLERDDLEPIGGAILPMAAVAVIAAIGLASFGFALGMSFGRCALRTIHV